jgi:hypothetical protein
MFKSSLKRESQPPDLAFSGLAAFAAVAVAALLGLPFEGVTADWLEGFRRRDLKGEAYGVVAIGEETALAELFAPSSCWKKNKFVSLGTRGQREGLCEPLPAFALVSALLNRCL